MKHDGCFLESLVPRPSRCAAALFALSLILLVAPPSFAAVIDSPTTFAVADASDGLVDGVFNVVGDLTIATGGRITCNDPATPADASACDIKIVVTGNMEMRAGSAILAENRTASGNGGNILITVAGNAVMQGPSGANPGARISSSDTTGGGTTGKAGNITLQIGNDAVAPPSGDFTMAPGAQILADSVNQSGGAIVIDVARSGAIDGVVESSGGTTGTGGTQRPGGGPISVTAGCDLTVTDAGKISSRGKDPGADLVRLQGGCAVAIFGLVESTGVGHRAPNAPANHCSGPSHPDKPPNSVACVEVWAGNSLTIDGKNHYGQVSADKGGPGGSSGFSWIDLSARGPIAIIGSTDTPFAVHANGLAGTNDRGGAIAVVSRDANVVATDLAIQADAVNPGGAGGAVDIRARLAVNLETARIFARGDFVAAGGFGFGGSIEAHSFSGALSWQHGVGDVRPTGDDTIAPFDDDPPPARRGVIMFENCTTGVVSTASTDFPHNGDAATTPLTVAIGACGGSPALPQYVTLPDCLCDLAGQNTCIHVTKVCADATTPGGAISFSGSVTNCGTELLSSVSVTDDHGTPGIPGDDVAVLNLGSLAAGASASYSGSYTPAHSPSTDTVKAGGIGAITLTPVTSTASATCTVPPLASGGGDEGCTPGYWKQSQHFDSWGATGFVTNQTAGSVFSGLAAACPSLATKTLLQSLDGGGGATFCNKVQILIRAAVAAVLDAAHPSVDYPRTVTDIQSVVNAAIATGNSTTVTNLGTALDKDNNRGCPLN